MAIIGVSGYARLVLSALRQALPAIRGKLAAATIVNQNEETETSESLESEGTVIFDDYRAMLEAFHGKLDLCVIPTSIHWHARMSMDALAAGAHVLVEKPLAGSVADALEVVRVSRETGRFVAVGFQDMYSAATYDIKRFILSRRLGRLCSMRASGSWARGEWYYKRNGWAGKMITDGRATRDSPINNAFAHFLNLCLFFAGPTAAGFANPVSFAGRLLRHYPIETFDTADVSLVTSDGVAIRCMFTHSDEAESSPEIRLSFEKGTLTWRFEKDAIATESHGAIAGKWILHSSDEARHLMIANVLKCAVDEGVPLCTAEQALHHVRAVAEIMEKLPICNGGADYSSWSPHSGLLGSLQRI